MEDGQWLTFERFDEVLPILPPLPIPSNRANRSFLSSLSQSVFNDEPRYSREHGQDLPPRATVPLEAHSRYMLKIVGLPHGTYKLICNKLPCGQTTSNALEAGVNLNTLLLDAGLAAPWNDLAQKIWDGARLEESPERRLQFEVKRAN